MLGDGSVALLTKFLQEHEALKEERDSLLRYKAAYDENADMRAIIQTQREEIEKLTGALKIADEDIREKERALKAATEEQRRLQNRAWNAQSRFEELEAQYAGLEEDYETLLEKSTPRSPLAKAWKKLAKQYAAGQECMGHLLYKAKRRIEDLEAELDEAAEPEEAPFCAKGYTGTGFTQCPTWEERETGCAFCPHYNRPAEE